MEGYAEYLWKHRVFTLIFLCKARHGRAKHLKVRVYFLSPDKDRAAYPAAWEAPPSVYLLPRQLWQQQQEEGPSRESR